MDFDDKKYVFYYANDKKPAFYLIRYGDTINLSCNREITLRLSNILSDCAKNENCPASLVSFNQHLKLMLGNREDHATSHTSEFSYLCIKYDYVYSIIINKNFAKALDKVIGEFLAHTEVSPPLFCLAKQLEAIVRFQNRPPYADETTDDDKAE